jgi:hypothetical protein
MEFSIDEGHYFIKMKLFKVEHIQINDQAPDNKEVKNSHRPMQMDEEGKEDKLSTESTDSAEDHLFANLSNELFTDGELSSEMNFSRGMSRKSITPASSKNQKNRGKKNIKSALKMKLIEPEEEEESQRDTSEIM